jgi:hypothetical protein
MVWTTPVASIVSSTWKSTVVTASTEHQTSSADASAVCKAAPVMLRSAIPVDWCIPKSISGQCGRVDGAGYHRHQGNDQRRLHNVL